MEYIYAEQIYRQHLMGVFSRLPLGNIVCGLDVSIPIGRMRAEGGISQIEKFCTGIKWSEFELLLPFN